MKREHRPGRLLAALGVGLTLAVAGSVWLISLSQESKAGPPGHRGDGPVGWAFYGREGLVGPQAMAGTWYKLPGPDGGAWGDCAAGVCVAPGKRKKKWHGAARGCDDGYPHDCGSDVGGSWFWMRSPEQERVVISGLYNRYCMRCHGVDGRGTWDIPGVPDFTNPRWQVTRSNDQIARIIIEGRGAVMPPFRGTLTLEEAWAMARYLRTLVPGSEPSRPEVGRSEEKKSTPPSEPLPPPAKAK